MEGGDGKDTFSSTSQIVVWYVCVKRNSRNSLEDLWCHAQKNINDEVKNAKNTASRTKHNGRTNPIVVEQSNTCSHNFEEEEEVVENWQSIISGFFLDPTAYSLQQKEVILSSKQHIAYLLSIAKEKNATCLDQPVVVISIALSIMKSAHSIIFIAIWELLCRPLHPSTAMLTATTT